MSTPEDRALAAREAFGSREVTLGTAELAAAAVAAQAKAAVEARYIMAMNRPRNWDDVRDRLLRECRRPAFAANTSALYHKPIGRGVEGLGIRFVEVGLRCMSNVLVETPTVFEDELREVIRVQVTDLESNMTYSQDIRITKTVERSKPSDDGTYVSVRKNSQGRDVYTVPGTEDDLLNKRNAALSKTVRTLGLRIIPGDLQDEAEAIIRQIRTDRAAKDPDAERKKVADAFSGMGVKPSDLATYLGHGLDSCSPAELVNLRGIYGAIRDGEMTWASVIDSAEPEKPKNPVDSVKRKQEPPASPAEPPQAAASEPDPDEGGGSGSPGPQGAAQEPETWPKPGDTPGSWRDSAGEIYDSARHAWSRANSAPSVNSDGTFRARRRDAPPADPAAPPLPKGGARPGAAPAPKEDSPPADPPDGDLTYVLQRIFKGDPANAEEGELIADFIRELPANEQRVALDAHRAKWGG